MRVALDWLSDFVELPELQVLVDGLVEAGVEVEDVVDPSSSVSGVVCAAVRACEAHPKADKLKVCTVFDGDSEHTVVCGAANVAVGERVAFARVGAKLGDFEIGARKLRGVESFGMLCSRDELGLPGGHEDGLWLLGPEAPLGMPVFEAFPAAVVLELGITPNRPDLLSHLGVAREVAAMTGKRTKSPTRRVVEQGAAADGMLRVVVEDGVGCPRYLARVVNGVTVGPSPAWLRARLESVGLRSINNVVDATNHVLMELGQPLHAFDLAKLNAENGVATLKVRRGGDSERLTTLDDTERELIPADLVIADARVPVAIAGVMGGANSEVGDDTKDIVLECACFEPTTVRKTSRRLGLHTDASHRFERGIDAAALQRAVDRCAQIISEVAGGTVAKGTVEVSQKVEARPSIRLRPERLAAVLGVNVPQEQIIKLLEPLEIRCEARHDSALQFEAPSFRPDLADEIDLIEEVARRYGYDAIPDRLPDAGGPFHFTPVAVRPRDRAREALLSSGVSEAVCYGFGSPKAFATLEEREGAALRLLNPLGEELSALRTSLVPGLLDALARNQRQGAPKVQLFEIGTTFHPSEGGATDARDAKLPFQQERLAVVIWGLRHGYSWFGKQDAVDPADIVGIVENLVAAFAPARGFSIQPMAIDGLNPHASGELSLGGVAAGWVGTLHPAWLRAHDVRGPVFAAEISLDALARAERRSANAVRLPRYPGTRRDLAVLAPRDLPSERIRSYIESRAGGDLGPEVVERVQLFDVFSGKGIDPSQVSLAFAIEYRHRTRTLKDDEVNQAFETVIADLKRDLGLEIR